MDSSNTVGFASALDLMRDGKRVARKGWKNIKAIFIVDGSTFEVNRAPLNKFFPEGTKVTYNPHIDVIGTDDTVGVWTPTNFDVLSLDWYEVVDEAPAANGQTAA